MKSDKWVIFSDSQMNEMDRLVDLFPNQHDQ